MIFVVLKAWRIWGRALMACILLILCWSSKVVQLYL